MSGWIQAAMQQNTIFTYRKARIFDCNQVSHKSWTVDGEVEKVLWDHFNPFNFIVSNDNLTLTAVLCYTKVCINLNHCLLLLCRTGFVKTRNHL